MCRVAWARLLRALLLFPDELGSRQVSPLDSSPHWQDLSVVNTFLHVESREAPSENASYKSSSEPRDFKPVSSSTCNSDCGAVPETFQTLPRDDDLPSDPEVAAETTGRLSRGSCVDRTCTTSCVYYLRGQCRSGSECESCHLCTLDDTARARRLRQRRIQAEAEQPKQPRRGRGAAVHSWQVPPPSPPAPALAAPSQATPLASDRPSQGSCRDGTCDRGCAWTAAECKKGRECFFCHVCLPSKRAKEQRRKREHFQKLRVVANARKKGGRTANEESVARRQQEERITL